MTEIYLKKVFGVLGPNDDDAKEYLEKLKSGEVIKATVTRPRNYDFHKKLFALLDVAYDAWEIEPVEYKGVPIEKNKTRFRKDITIMAGFYEMVVNVKGEVRAQAKSISFASMSEDEFSELYSKIIDVILKRVLKNYTRADLDRVVEEVMSFT